jgi:hypothetical protein
MGENEFIEQYRQWWESRDEGYVLIRTTLSLGFLPYNYKTGEYPLIENTFFANMLVHKMLESSLPIYESASELPEPMERKKYSSFEDWIKNAKKRE